MPRALKQIRWTIEQAAGEFGLDRKNLSNRLRESGIVPGDDKKFSTTEICRAVFKDGDAARTSLAIAQREKCEIQTDKLADKLADVNLFQAISDNMIIVLRQKITDAPIAEDIKLGILREIQKINVDELVKENSTPDDSDLEDQPPIV